MAEIPTYISQNSPETRESGGYQRGASGGKGTILAGQSLNEVAQSLSHTAQIQAQTEDEVRRITLHQQNTISQLSEQKAAQVEALESSQKYSKLRTDWNKRLIEYQTTPTENLLGTATKEYDDYVGKMLDGASNENVRNKLALQSAEFRIGFVNDAFRLNSQQQLAQFGASYDTMLSNAEDSIFAAKSITELASQKSLLIQTVDDAVKTGQIRNPEIAQNLKEKANLLSVSWAQANLADNPALVTSVVNGEKPFEHMFDGVSIQQKELLLEKAKNIQQTHSNQEKLILRDAFESDKVQRVKTGEGASLDLDRFEQAFGKPARDSAERELFNATRLHSYYERSLGASGEELNSLLKESSPRPQVKLPDGKVATVLSIGVGDDKGEWVIPTVVDGTVVSKEEAIKLWQEGKNKPLGGPFKTIKESKDFAEEFHKTQEEGTFHEQQDLHDNVMKIVRQSVDDKKDDAFTYFSRNPAVKNLVQDFTNNPTPETRNALTQSVLDLQKMDKSLQPYEYKVMPRGEAEKFVDQFNKLVEIGNKSDGAGVRDLLVSFSNQYQPNLHIALGQLASTKGGDKITPKLNPLMWHINNPSTFRLIVDAIRKDPSEAYGRFPTSKEKNNFLEEVGMDKNLIHYQSSLFSTDNSSSASTLAGGVRDTFRDFARDYVLNGGKMKDASDIFFQNYTWGNMNGASFARPRVYSDKLGNTHVMSDEQVRLSDNYLSFYPQTLDPSTIAPESIVNQTKLFTTEQLTKDVSNALRSNTFWSTTEDETGVYLFTKGSISGTARQVFRKDGTPVRVNFEDTSKSIPMLSFGEKSPIRASTPKTGDTWLDSLANFLSRMD